MIIAFIKNQKINEKIEKLSKFFVLERISSAFLKFYMGRLLCQRNTLRVVLLDNSFKFKGVLYECMIDCEFGDIDLII